MKKPVKFGIFFLSVLILTLLFGLVSETLAVPQSPVLFEKSVSQDDPDLAAAVAAALQSAGSRWQEFDYQIDYVQYQDDGQMAIVWLAAYDLLTGEVLGREPELALAVWQGGRWEVLLEGSSGFEAAFTDFQYGSKSLLDDSMLAGDKSMQEDVVYGGYYLPWAATLEKRLTWSVGHTSCYPIYYCTHAFDFADGTMFPILAAKGGTVYHWKDTCANGDPNCTNSITIQDRSTTPWTYQIYIHLAHDSVPEDLKVVGTPVMQGQFIGNVDDTGASTAHHLHFMVVTEDTKYISGNGYVWGIAEDITFRDVFINWDEATQGGRPRLAYEAASYGGEGQTYYVSGNVPADPPTGGLTAPANRALITGSELTISGWGEDDVAVSKMEILANLDGSWFAIGEEQTDNPFTTTIDLCETDIPDGPFQLALRVWDAEGNPSMPLTIRNLVKDASCSHVSVATCSPGSYQAAVFGGPNYTGACQVLGLGSYPDLDALAPLGQDQIASVKLGTYVQINLFSDEQYQGRMETLTDNDRHLIDNAIGAGTVSSVVVRARNISPDDPVLDPVLGPENAAPVSTDSLILTWAGKGATKFYAELYQDQIGGVLVDARYWSEEMFWSLGSLPPGDYAWRVRGRIAVPRGTTYDTYYSSWVADTFTVAAAAFPSGDPLSVPFYEVFDFGQGDWLETLPWQAFTASGGGFYWGTGSGVSYLDHGSFTSPVIQTESAEDIFLRFDYLADTGDVSQCWDQRLLQMSVAGEPFQDLAQFYGETQNRALVSQYIDLSAFAGRDFRLRWLFDPLDQTNNQGGGWQIDNVRIAFSGPPEDIDSDDSFSGATLINDAETLFGVIDHPGDVDFYYFVVLKDDVIVLDLDAQSLSPSSQLDSVLTLYSGEDDQPMIAENNDETTQTLDSRLIYRIPESGVYYVRVRDNDHPGVGGSAYPYALTLSVSSGQEDTSDPLVTLTTPDFRGGLPNAGDVAAEALDGASGAGIFSVAFYFHDQNWESDGPWMHLGTDYYGGDGWQVPFSTAGLPAGEDYAILALATDLVGNVGVDVRWDALVDRTDPWLMLEPLQNPAVSNSLLLAWAAGDAGSGIGHFSLQVNINHSGWQMVDSWISAETNQYLYRAMDAQLLKFRLTAYDVSGNSVASETFTTTPGYPFNYFFPIIYR